MKNCCVLFVYFKIRYFSYLKWWKYRKGGRHGHKKFARYYVKKIFERSWHSRTDASFSFNCLSNNEKAEWRVESERKNHRGWQNTCKILFWTGIYVECLSNTQNITFNYITLFQKIQLLYKKIPVVQNFISKFCTFFIWRKSNVRIPIRNKANCGLSALSDL